MPFDGSECPLDSDEVLELHCNLGGLSQLSLLSPSRSSTVPQQNKGPAIK